MDGSSLTEYLAEYTVRVPGIGPRLVFHLQRLGAAYGSQDWPGVVQATTRSRPDVVSIDVFDTCLVRDLAGDHAIEHVIDHLGANSARSNGSGPGDESTPVADQVERLLCRPVPGVASALAELRAVGAELVFVSDTDRSSTLLVDILRSHGLFVDQDRLVASCEAGATKSDGDLFPLLFGPRAADSDRTVWHIGNNLWTDVAMAAQAGVRPVPVIDADTNRYERAMAARADGYGPAVAGAARRARLEIEHEHRQGLLGDREAKLQSLGAGVAGQTMAAFVLWVAERSREDRIEHLAFLARDGELPLDLARAMPSDHWEGRSLRYLHCSRMTWALAAASVSGVERWLHEGTVSDEAFLHAKRYQVPFQALLSRIGLTSADLAAEPRHASLAALGPGEYLSPSADSDWNALLDDPIIQERVAEAADERLKLVVDRLRADGFPAGKFGLIDVGWRGRLATQVSAVLTQVVGEDPIHYHFGGHKVVGPEPVTIRRFAFDGVSDPAPIDAPVSCVETLTASGKPRVVEYRRGADGSVEMVFDDSVADAEGDRVELWAGAHRAAALIPSRLQLESWGLQPGSLAEEAVDVLDLWWNRPTRSEVAALEGLVFEHDEAGTALRPLINPYRLSDLRSDGAPAARQWPQGSVVASDPVMGSVARLVRLTRAWKERRGKNA